MLYATDGGSLGRDTCLGYPSFTNDASSTVDGTWGKDYSVCMTNNWLADTTINTHIEFLLNPIPVDYSNSMQFIFRHRPNGDDNTKYQNISMLYSYSSYQGIRPTVYLKRGVAFAKTGDGSSNNPFQLIYVR